MAHNIRSAFGTINIDVKLFTLQGWKVLQNDTLRGSTLASLTRSHALMVRSRFLIFLVYTYMNCVTESPEL